MKTSTKKKAAAPVLDTRKLFTVNLWTERHKGDDHFVLVETYGVLSRNLTQVVAALVEEYPGACVSFRNELATANVALLADQVPHSAKE